MISQNTNIKKASQEVIGQEEVGSSEEVPALILADSTQ